jgi:hypothetical protein
MKKHGGNLNSLLSERSQSEKSESCMIPTKCPENYGDNKKIIGLGAGGSNL